MFQFFHYYLRPKPVFIQQYVLYLYITLYIYTHTRYSLHYLVEDYVPVLSLILYQISAIVFLFNQYVNSLWFVSHKPLCIGIILYYYSITANIFLLRSILKKLRMLYIIYIFGYLYTPVILALDIIIRSLCKSVFYYVPFKKLLSKSV